MIWWESKYNQTHWGYPTGTQRRFRLSNNKKTTYDQWVIDVYVDKDSMLVKDVSYTRPFWMFIESEEFNLWEFLKTLRGLPLETAKGLLVTTLTMEGVK